MRISSTATDMASLIGTGLGHTFGENLFVGREPSAPMDSITIFDTPPSPSMLALSGENYEYPSIQIRVRATNYLKGFSMAKEIQLFLHGKSNFIIGNHQYTLIQSMGEPALLDWDANNRARFIINFEIQRKLKKEE